MEYEVLSLITQKDGSWVYTGQIIDKDVKIPVTGRISIEYKTNGMIKSAIIEQMEARVKEREQVSKPPVTKRLSTNNIFKEQLTVNPQVLR